MSGNNGTSFRKFDVLARHTDVNLVNDHFMVSVIIASKVETGCELDCTLVNLLNGEELCFFTMKLIDDVFRIHDSNGKDLYIGQEIIELYKKELIIEITHNSYNLVK